MKKVLKRDGQIAIFDSSKIKKAILKAFIAVDGEADEYAERKAENIANYIEGYYEDITDPIDIEEIQDLVEHGLMSTKRKDIAKAYVLYREERSKEREKKSKLRKQIKEKLHATSVQNQNANLDEHSFGGRMGEANSLTMKDIALYERMSKMARENHLNNIIYIHDLDAYEIGSHNCLTVPFDHLLRDGFNTRQTDVRGAQSISTAFQLVAVIFQLQSLCQFGGVSAGHLDWTMVPYVRKSFSKHFKDGIKYILDDENYSKNVPKELSFDDPEANSEYNKKVYKYAMDMTIKETKQAVEGMYHNLNTLQSRSGNQLPFTSINYGTCVLPEGRLVIKAILEASIEGVGTLHKTSIFPCSIFQCMKGVNRYPDDPNYDLYRLALKSTAKRLYPNYANCDWSNNAGYDKNDPSTYFGTMGCRTANLWDINGLGQQKDGRGNICPVTIILPTIAMKAKKTFDKGNGYIETEQGKKDLISYFLRCLNQKIYEAKEMLLERFEHICSQMPESAKFMYENNLMAGYIPEEGIRSALKHGTLALG